MAPTSSESGLVPVRIMPDPNKVNNALSASTMVITLDAAASPEVLRIPLERGVVCQDHQDQFCVLINEPPSPAHDCHGN